MRASITATLHRQLDFCSFPVLSRILIVTRPWRRHTLYMLHANKIWRWEPCWFENFPGNEQLGEPVERRCAVWSALHAPRTFRDKHLWNGRDNSYRDIPNLTSLIGTCSQRRCWDDTLHVERMSRCQDVALLSCRCLCSPAFRGMNLGLYPGRLKL
jgi:hypothetical protein